MTSTYLSIIAYLQTNQFIASLVVLPIVVMLNILLGWGIANFKDQLDMGKLKLGILKGILIYFSIAVLSLISEIIMFANVDLRGEMSIAVYTVVGAYLAQVLIKLWTLLNYNKPGETQGGTVVPEVAE